MVYVVIGMLVIVVLAMWIVGTRNSLVRKKIKIQEALSGIEVALTKRYDVLVKMRDVAQNYAQHEKEVLYGVICMRKGMSLEELEKANNVMNQMMSDVNFLAEAYPQLRSENLYVELQKGIRDTEDHLQASRRLYNSNVSIYNTAIAMFPTNIIANMKGFVGEKFFEAESFKYEDVKM